MTEIQNRLFFATGISGIVALLSLLVQGLAGWYFCTPVAALGFCFLLFFGIFFVTSVVVGE